VRRSERDVKSLIIDAVIRALDDAGISPGEVDGIITEGMMTPNYFLADDLAEQMGFSLRYNATFSSIAPGMAYTPLMAAMAIREGLADVIVSYFGVDWGSSAEGPYAYHKVYPAKGSFEAPYGFYGQPSYFGMIASRYMHEYGLTSRQLASVALTQRRHALLNGNAQMRKPITYEDYEMSRVVADPLRVLDCCLMTDGAAAFVMCSPERAAYCKQPPVYMMGAGYHCAPISGNSIFVQNPEYLSAPGATEATQQALRMAGISLQEIDFAEIYDCFSISVLLEMEDIGFCKKGEAGAFIEEGHTAIGGSLPVNTHGGLMSHGYLLGINHVVEMVRQLRGQAGPAQVNDAEIGLFGGMGSPEYGALILGKG